MFLFLSHKLLRSRDLSATSNWNYWKTDIFPAFLSLLEQHHSCPSPVSERKKNLFEKFILHNIC